MLEIINNKSSQFFRLSKKSRIFSNLDLFYDYLDLYLLRNNLYRIIDRKIKDTKIRKLVKLKLPKVLEFRANSLDFNQILQLVISIMKIQILSKSIGLEHPTVKRVIEIAEEIMSKNKVLNIETLYYMAKKSLKLSRQGLLFIIQFLIN